MRPAIPALFRSTAVPAAALTLIALAVAAAPAALAQFEAATGDITEDAVLSGYPTIEGIRKARRAGHTEERILAWIREQNAIFALDLDEAMQLRSEGLGIPVISAMAQMPPEVVGPLLETFDKVFVARSGPRQGLSKRHLLKMREYGAPEQEILETIAVEGSRAELTLAEAVKLMQDGASPRLVVAIGRGIVPPEIGAKPSPLLDDLLAGEMDDDDEGDDDEGEDDEDDDEAIVSLDEIFEDEGLPVEPEGGPRLVVLSSPPGARISIAPSSIRPTDLLTLPRSSGRTPAALRVDPGSWFVLVEKPLDAFDQGIIPAMRTVHDGDGTTRTLIQSGTLYYDVQDCCRPRGLVGPLQITRIAEDQPGSLLGDEFDGMPPYLWDGNRYLVIQIEEGRIQRLIKVYVVKRAVAEERTLMATFIPSSADPLEHPINMEAISTRARTVWAVPPVERFGPLARMSGVPEEDVEKVHARLLEAGKALWKDENDQGVRIVSFGLESMGRLRMEDIRLERTDIYGMLETPRPGTTAAPKGQPAKEPGPIPPFRRIRRPEQDLPLVEITNNRGSGALVRLGDGTTFYVAPGGTVSSEVSPGTYAVEARFDAADASPLHGQARFSYHALYRLSLN